MQDKYLQFFEETRNVFEETKKYTLFIEKFSKGDKVPIVSINELRGTLFHLYKFLEKESGQEQYIEAKEHLFRACYDTYSILVGILIKRIVGIKDLFSEEVISTIYPTYYSNIRPKLVLLQEEIAHIRSDRNTILDNGKEGSSSERYRNVMLLIKWYKEIQANIPELGDYQRGLKRKNDRNTLLKILIPAIVAIISFILGKVI